MASIANLYGNRTTTPKEQRCIVLVAAGLTNKDVSRLMRTTEHVVKNLLRSIYDKLGLWNRLELALWYEHREWERKHAKDQAAIPALPVN